MSGFPCSECGRNVSDDVCPSCGTHTPVPARSEPSEPIAKPAQLDAVKAALAVIREARKNRTEKGTK